MSVNKCDNCGMPGQTTASCAGCASVARMTIPARRERIKRA